MPSQGERSRWRAIRRLAVQGIICATILFCLYLLIAPSCQMLWEAGETTRSWRSLSEIGVAIHRYHDAHKHLPGPARDRDGRPLLSWRVTVLEYTEHASLFQRFRRDEPWDSPHNLTLLDEM